MHKFRVLIADNDPSFLTTLTEVLENAEYGVLQAPNLKKADELLNTAWVHLAIIDIRMMDDSDDRDMSGLELAKQEKFHNVPKIILTDFPSYQAVRDALSPTREGLPPAIAFVAKREGTANLIQAVEQTFAQHFRINWDLAIDWKAGNPYSLVTLIEPDLEGERLLNRAEELEDLFRRLFYEKNQIRIDRLFWQRAGRAALTVFAFKEGAAPEHFVVVCGQNVQVVDEARRYNEFAPKAPGDTGTALSIKAETTHFAANAYTLAGADLENVRTLAECYRSGPDKLFNVALNTLFEKTLAAWYQDKRILEEGKTLDEVYSERLGLIKERMSRDAFVRRVEALARQIPTLGTQIELVDETLIIRFDRRSFSYPDPTLTLYRMPDVGRPVTLINAPGTLSGDNVLTDATGHSWLTDFADAGHMPLLWNFVALEAAIRFDWVEEKNLHWLHGMEYCLVTSEFNKLSLGDVEPPLRRPVRAIQVIRRLVSRTLGKDARPYHVGVLFQAASRLANFDPAVPLMPSELARLAHALIAAAMIYSVVVQMRQSATADAAPETKGIRLDKDSHAIWVEGRRIPSLRGQGYDLLCYLHERANKLCARREIVEQVLKEKYDEKDESQVSRLNTAIGRLRDKIEPDPDHPRYLITETGAGYMLVTSPPD